MKLGDSELKFDNNNKQLDIKVADGGGTLQRSISSTATGGTLHGTWTSEEAVTTSDRRLKKSIVPLYRAIADEPAAPSVEKDVRSTDQRDSVVSWVLRELRPVSFSFKSGLEAKHSRYGFVAQELQQVLPALVRGTSDEHLSVVYQDLIALLTMAAQSLQAKMAEQEKRMQRQDLIIEKLVRSIEELDKKIEQRSFGSQPSHMRHV